MALNPRYKFDPAMMMEDAMGWSPAPWQVRVLRSESSRLALLCPRQAGKSWTTACKALHRALCFPYSTVLLISRSQDQADELHAKVIRAYNNLGRPVRAARELISEINFVNFSRIVALPLNPDTVRGWTADLLIIDEASRVPQAMITALLPMLMASKGDCVILSTPAGQTGYFYEQFTDPAGRWEKIKVTCDQVPHFDPRILAEVERQLGPTMARQELWCDFVRDGQSVFSVDSINAAFSSDLPAIRGF